MALHMAYIDGLVFAQRNQLSALVPHAIQAAGGVFDELEFKPEILIEAGCVSSHEFMEDLYRDGKALPDLWKKAPDLAEIIAYWQGLNDASQFVTAFVHFRSYRGDYRAIHKAVTNSLSHYKLLDERKVRGPLAFEGFAPPPAPRLPICLPRLMLVHP